MHRPLLALLLLCSTAYGQCRLSWKSHILKDSCVSCSLNFTLKRAIFAGQKKNFHSHSRATSMLRWPIRFLGYRERIGTTSGQSDQVRLRNTFVRGDDVHFFFKNLNYRYIMTHSSGWEHLKLSYLFIDRPPSKLVESNSSSNYFTGWRFRFV